VAIKAVCKALLRSPAGPLLLAAQVALSLMIFANVAYVVFVRFETTGRPTGIDLPNIFWFSTEGYGRDFNQQSVTQPDLQYLNSLPNVISASASNTVPQTFDALRSLVSASPRLEGSKREAILYLMTERAVETLGLHLVQGRGFDQEAMPPLESSSQPQRPFGSEVIITEALANKLFGSSRNALGKPLYFSMLDGGSATIVGVVAVMQAGAYFAPGADFINEVALVPAAPAGRGTKYLVRTNPGARDQVMTRVRREFEPLQPLRYIDHMEGIATTAATMREADRHGAIVLAVLSSFVLAVTMLGLFGFASFAVTSRTKEIGTRRAIGATRSDIVNHFLFDNWLITSVGIAVGSVITLAFALQLSMLLELPRLPLAFLIGSMVLIWLAGLLAALLPALRGARVPPAVATRTA
jgi:putative ABC transport system permease protein